MSSVLCLSPSVAAAVHHHHHWFGGCCSSPELTLSHPCSSFTQVDSPIKRLLGREENQKNHQHLKGEASPKINGSNKLRLVLQRPHGSCGWEEEGGGGDSGRAGGGGPIYSTAGSPSYVSMGKKRRMRPAMLHIPPPPEPVESAGSPLGERVDAPKELEFEGDGYSVFCRRGRKRLMEDSYTAIVDLLRHPKQMFFGVFDGHGGTSAAEFACNNLGPNIMAQALPCGEEDCGIMDVVKNGYLMTDSDFLKQEVRSGACCVTAWFRKGDCLVVSNVGDCRAVLSREGCAEALTTDHQPSLESEKERIESLGGYVDFCHGAWRVQGTLAVSRGIGDRHLKRWVSAEPDTKVLRITPECEFLILATDGLWGKVSNQEAVDLVRPFCVGACASSSSVLSACKMLAELAVSRGSLDDVSVMLIQVQRFSFPSYGEEEERNRTPIAATSIN